MESARLELTDDLNARHAQINELDCQLTHEIRAAPDGYRRPSGTAGPIRYRGEAHNRSRGRTRRRARKLALLEDEKCSLQIAVDQALNETAG